MNKIIHLFKLGWAYKIARTAKLSYPPYQYTIEPTNLCNLRCAFCPQSDPEHHKLRPSGYLSVENFKIFLEKMSKSGSSNRNLNFTLDGEPFLNKNFIEMIRLANMAGYFPVFASNGILLDPDKIERIVSAGGFRVSIDFASDEKIFESVRAKPGQFEIAKNNLTNLIEKARVNPNVQIDIHDISSFAGMDEEKSLTATRALFPENPPDSIKFLIRRFHNFCGHLENKADKDKYRLCPYPWTQMAVTWDGNCVACCRDTAGRNVFGNVFEQSIIEIWNGNEYRRFRQNLLDHKPELNDACENCDLPYSGDDKRWRVKYIIRSLLGR